jgi:hypothetical protein
MNNNIAYVRPADDDGVCALRMVVNGQETGMDLTPKQLRNILTMGRMFHDLYVDNIERGFEVSDD